MFTRFCILLNLLTIIYCDVPFSRVTPEGTFNYIRRDWQTASYNETTDWCSRLGGSLPVLHTREDLDFLADKVLGRTLGRPSRVWLAATQVRPKVCQWKDNTSIETFHSWYNPSSTYSCTGCCAVSMWTDRDLTVYPCSNKLWQVCVVRNTTIENLIETTISLKNDLEGVKHTIHELNVSLQIMMNNSILQDTNQNQRFLDLKADTDTTFKNLSHEQQLQMTTLESKLMQIITNTSGLIQGSLKSLSSEQQQRIENSDRKTNTMIYILSWIAIISLVFLLKSFWSTQSCYQIRMKIPYFKLKSDAHKRDNIVLHVLQR